MKDNQGNLQNYLEEDSIDIIALLKTLWIGKKLIVRTTILFFVIGCIVALLSPVVYTAQTTFIPQVSEDQMSTSKGGLGSLASLAGINFNKVSSTNDSYLSPLLYSKLAESEEFSLNIINEETKTIKNRIKRLSDTSLDLELLDQQARIILGMIGEDELIVF